MMDDIGMMDCMMDDMMDDMMDATMEWMIWRWWYPFCLKIEASPWGLCRWCDGGVRGDVRCDMGEGMGYHSASGQDMLSEMHL